MEISTYLWYQWWRSIHHFVFVMSFLLGFPILVCEYSIGRGSGSSIVTALSKLGKEGTRWHHFKYFGFIGRLYYVSFYWWKEEGEINKLTEC